MHQLLQRTWDDNAEIETALSDALAMVERLQPPDDLRTLTLQYAIQLRTQTAQRVGVPIANGAQLL